MREYLVEEIAAEREGAIKIGPFGSALPRSTMVPDGIKVYGQENLISRDWSIGDRRITSDSFERLRSCELHPGDVVIGMMGSLGHCEIFPTVAEFGLMDSHLLRIQPNVNLVLPEYLRLLLLSDETSKQIVRLSHGSIMAGLSSKIVKKVQLLLPPVEEQRRITEVLDSIDETIQATEAIIAKLEQQGQGLEVRLLHEVQDAQQLPLIAVATVDRGKFTARPRNDPAFFGGKYPFIQTGDVTRVQRATGIGFSQTLNELGLSVSRIFDTGTIAVTIAANIADSAILDRPMCFPDSVVGVTVAFPHSIRWVELCIHASKRMLDARAPQSAQKNINLQDLRQLTIPVPNPVVQHALAESWEYQQRSIGQEVLCLAKLKQLRSGLAFDLLSGRVRVDAA